MILIHLIFTVIVWYLFSHYIQQVFLRFYNLLRGLFAHLAPLDHILHDFTVLVFLLLIHLLRMQSVVIECLYKHNYLRYLPPWVWKRSINRVVAGHIILLLHLLLTIDRPGHQHSEGRDGSYINVLVGEVLAPAEQSEDTKAVEDPAKAAEEGREDNAFLGFIFVVVVWCCIKGHWISDKVESVHQKVELLLVEVGP